jgi:hypothetical protein
MQLIQASDAARLSGLTPDQLREWCGRRNVVVPDVPGAGRGRHALYSWQTVLTLRLLRELHERFGAEVGSWRVAIGRCQQILRGRSFPTLWSAAVAFTDNGHARLIEERVTTIEAVLVLPLAAHLQILAQASAFQSAQQLPLFSTVRQRS